MKTKPKCTKKLTATYAGMARFCSRAAVVKINGGNYCKQHGLQFAKILGQSDLPMTKTVLATGETVKIGYK